MKYLITLAAFIILMFLVAFACSNYWNEYFDTMYQGNFSESLSDKVVTAVVIIILFAVALIATAITIVEHIINLFDKESKDDIVNNNEFVKEYERKDVQ